MKDLGATKQILGTRINRDDTKGTLKLSQAKYIEKALKRFNMQNAKAINTPLGSYFKLFKWQSPKIEKEKEYMTRVPYVSLVA